MKHRIWFEQKFDLAYSVNAFPEVLERVGGTPARLERRLEGIDHDVVTFQPDGAWSIQEHVGHLGDLEPLWAGRLDDLVDRAERLRPADLANTATHEAHHNDTELQKLLAAFREHRETVVSRLEALGPPDLTRTALHPRLEQPMSIVDLFYFVGEHDDHHLATITRLMDGK